MNVVAPSGTPMRYACGHAFTGGPQIRPGREHIVRRVVRRLNCPRCRTPEQAQLAWRKLVRAYFRRY